MRSVEHCLVFALVILFWIGVTSAQSSSETNQKMSETPSLTRWCLAEAGDHPSSVIANRCKVYHECLGDLNLSEKVDQQPYSDLTETQAEGVRRCHQALYNAARMNPQVKG